MKKQNVTHGTIYLMFAQATFEILMKTRWKHNIYQNTNHVSSLKSNIVIEHGLHG